MTTTLTTSETEKPTTLSPREKKTQRLQARLDEIDAEIEGVRAKHKETIESANKRVAAVERKIVDVEINTRDLNEARTGTVQALEKARAIVVKHERTLVELDEKLAANTVTMVKLTEERATEEAARAEQLDEPNRHLAALQKDRDGVAYRLQQHVAREPHKALFVGSKS